MFFVTYDEGTIAHETNQEDYQQGKKLAKKRGKEKPSQIGRLFFFFFFFHK